MIAEQRKKILDALLRLPTVTDRAVRDRLLRDLPSDLSTSIERSNAPSTDLDSMLEAVATWDDEALDSFLDNAVSLAHGSQAASAISDLRAELRNSRGKKPDPGSSQLPPIFREPRSSFVGRNEELSDIERLLREENTRLLTLTGPPGVGKTRLALRVAAVLHNAPETSKRFTDGIYRIDLVDIHEADLVLSAIAQGFGTTANTRERLAGELQNRNGLVILDNFEQVLTAAPLIAYLVEATNLVFLITSRSPLQVGDEKEYRVNPFSVQALPTQASADILGVDAVQLFVQRTHRPLNKPFVPTEQEAPLLAAICSQLEGLPLAIEIVAPLARRKRLAEIQHMLAEKLDIESPIQYEDPRHRSLRAAITTSHKLLTPEEQELFRWLAVFVGGCTPLAVKEVCEHAATLLKTGFPSLPENLETLSDKGLLEQEWGSDRYYWLETIRAYALEELVKQQREEHALQTAHMTYYRDLAEKAEMAMERTPEQEHEVRARLAPDWKNLRAALKWAQQSRKQNDLARLSGALWRFWLQQGIFNEGLHWSEVALAKRNLARSLRAKVLRGAGILAMELEQLGKAQEYSQAALDLYNTLNDRSHAAAVLCDLANETSDLANCAESEAEGDSYAQAARALYIESLDLYRDLGDTRGLERVEQAFATLLAERRDYPGAGALYKSSAERAAAHENPRGIIWACCGLGRCAVRENEYAEARLHFTTAIGTCIEHKLGETIAGGLCLEGVAELAEAEGRAEVAARLRARATAQRERMNTPEESSAVAQGPMKVRMQGLGTSVDTPEGWAAQQTMVQALIYAREYLNGS